MYIDLKHSKKVLIFLLFWNLKQMAVCQGTRVADVGSAQRWKKSFNLMCGYTALQRKNLSSQHIISSTQLRLGNFLETIIQSYKKPQVPCTSDECNEVPICMTTKKCKEEAKISLQVSWTLQTHKVGLLSKLHKVDRKWDSSQKYNSDYFTTDCAMDSLSWQMYLFMKTCCFIDISFSIMGSVHLVLMMQN